MKSKTYMNKDTSILFIDDRSVEEFRLCVEGYPDIPSPERVVAQTENEYSINGSAMFKQGWKDISITVNLNYLEVDDPIRPSFLSAFHEIRAWLNTAKTISFSDDINCYYKVKDIKINGASREIIEHGTFSVTFICNPFASIRKDKVILDFGTVTSSSRFTRQFSGSGYVESYPKISVNGLYKDCEYLIAVSNENITYTITTSKLVSTSEAKYTLVIDSEEGIIYGLDNGAVIDIYEFIIADSFPRLSPGENAILLGISGGSNRSTAITVDVERNGKV